MAETDSTPASDVANALLVQLEAEAHYVDAGSFTLDPRKAREKLAAYQLAEPDRFVLLMVEAAHLLHGCKGVAFTIDTRSTKVVFEGVELRAGDLHGCFDALFIDVASLDPERARQMRGRQRLALALNAALGLPNGRVEMTSRIRGEDSVHAELDVEGRVHIREQPSTAATSELVVEVHRAPRWHKQRDLLRLEARYATVPVRVDGVRIDDDPSTNLVAPVEICDAAGQVVGRAGWCAAQATRTSGSIGFVANGVVLEEHLESTLPAGLFALLDASDLQRDISQTQIRRDAVHQQRVEAALAIGKTIAPPLPTLGPQPTDPAEHVMGVFSFLVGIVLLVGAFRWTLGLWLLGVFIFAVGLIIGAQGMWLIRRAHQRRRVRLHGQAGLGVIKYSSATGKKTPLGSREMFIDMWIERAGQDGYKAAFHAPVARALEHLVEAGKRVYVRVDPSDPQFVVFDAGEQPEHLLP
jgi:hypothetical protein